MPPKADKYEKTAVVETKNTEAAQESAARKRDLEAAISGIHKGKDDAELKIDNASSRERG